MRLWRIKAMLASKGAIFWALEVCPSFSKRAFQFHLPVQVVFQALLAAGRNDQDVFDPAWMNSSMIKSMEGLLIRGSISLGMVLVTGRKRVP
jgi:hypothetical protein